MPDASTPMTADDPQADQPSAFEGETQDRVHRLLELRSELEKVILGQTHVIDQVLVTLLCGGHALLEGVPGTAKTLLVRTLAVTLQCTHKRIQFTPDLMPADITGTNTYNLKTQEFELHHGPIFTPLLLADEINRAPAKTQSALLEAMSERRVTIDGTSHQLSPVFSVFATQNPVEFEGTYPLPEAQQDRFLMKVRVPYPSADAERALLEAVHRGDPQDQLETKALRKLLTVDDLLALRADLAKVRVESGVCDYVLKITRTTREHDLLVMGAGPRGSIYLLQASKARALVHGRDFVTPDDVVAMVEPVLGHRVALTAEAEIAGEQVASVFQNILNGIEVPR